jgi:hypothetical protein
MQPVEEPCRTTIGSRRLHAFQRSPAESISTVKTAASSGEHMARLDAMSGVRCTRLLQRRFRDLILNAQTSAGGAGYGRRGLAMRLLAGAIKGGSRRADGLAYRLQTDYLRGSSDGNRFSRHSPNDAR